MYTSAVYRLASFGVSLIANTFLSMNSQHELQLNLVLVKDFDSINQSVHKSQKRRQSMIFHLPALIPLIFFPSLR